MPLFGNYRKLHKLSAFAVNPAAKQQAASVSLTNCILSPSDVAVIGPSEVRFAEVEAEQRPRGTLATVMTHRVFHARLSKTGLLISCARGVEPTFRSNGTSPSSWLGDAPHGGLSAQSRTLLLGCEDLVIGFKLWPCVDSRSLY